MLTKQRERWIDTEDNWITCTRWLQETLPQQRRDHQTHCGQKHHGILLHNYFT